MAASWTKPRKLARSETDCHQHISADRGGEPEVQTLGTRLAHLLPQ